MRASPLPVLLTAAVLLGGCASSHAQRLAFSDGLAAEYRLSDEQKGLLQYYASGSIRLVRSASDGETGVRDGRLVRSARQAVDEVVIDRGTPGVVLSSGANWMAVSFEPGTYLYFVSAAPLDVWLGEDYVQDRYYLYIPDWNGRSGGVRLGDAVYTAVGDSYRAYLEVGRESFSSVSTRQWKLPGRLLHR